MKTNLLAVLLFGCCGILAFSPSMSAHHAAGLYESNSITVKGTVTNFEWTNPHSIVSIQVRDDKGNTEIWSAEVMPPTEMTRAGWTRDIIKPGDEVAMTGRPGKHAQHIMWLEYLVTADGRKLSRNPS